MQHFLGTAHLVITQLVPPEGSCPHGFNWVYLFLYYYYSQKCNDLPHLIMKENMTHRHQNYCNAF